MLPLRVCSKISKSRLPIKSARLYSLASSNHPAKLTPADLGKLYRVDQNSLDVLNFQVDTHRHYSKQIETLGECVWLCRTPLLEAINCIKTTIGPSNPSLRIVLWGQFGTGKSLTVNQLVHYAHDEGFVIFHVPSVIRWTRQPPDIEVSTYKPGRIDMPNFAVRQLQTFKRQNQHMWKTLNELTTEREYTWSKVEKTPAGRPLTDIVEIGLSAPFSATDCVGALCKELRRYASAGSIKLMVALDHANSLYGKTKVKKADFTIATADELTLILHMRKFFQAKWTNGVCVLVADKAEISDARDPFTFPLITPVELFGEQGFEAIDPFIPIETANYTTEEANAIYDYYSEMNWITQAKVPEARKQLYYLSASNPFNYERLCAFT